MERKLASVQRIIDISPIEGADRIERATILGWHCVVGRNEFKTGDLVVFLEVDSVTPQTETYKILKDSGYRVKTRRFKKQVSQGLCLSLSILPPMDDVMSEQGVSGTFYDEGDDVTEVLQIEKYEPYVPAQLSGVVKGPFPEFLHKTDEQRINSLPQLLDKHQNKSFYVTEKVDGSSMTVYLNNGEFGVCSRNTELKPEGNTVYWEVAGTHCLEAVLRGIGRNLAFQGEVVGQGVQSNKYKLPGRNFYIFNIFDIDKQQYLCYNDFKELTFKLELLTVPIISEEFLLPKTVDELVEYSKGKSLLNKDVPREGVVLRPLVEEYEPDLYGRLSFKNINPDFLLKYDSE